MLWDAEITCPKCRETFLYEVNTENLNEAFTCPVCKVAFKCHTCNYSWAKWARGRNDCGEPCK